MLKSSNNRRRAPRLRIHRAMPVPIHIFPVLPFLGESVEANLLNISTTGMALLVTLMDPKHKIGRGTKIRIHFRLPRQPLFECVGEVVRNRKSENDETLLGIRFTKRPRLLTQALHSMQTNLPHRSFEIAFQHFE